MNWSIIFLLARARAAPYGRSGSSWGGSRSSSGIPAGMVIGFKNSTASLAGNSASMLREKPDYEYNSLRPKFNDYGMRASVFHDYNNPFNNDRRSFKKLIGQTRSLVNKIEERTDFWGNKQVLDVFNMFSNGLKSVISKNIPDEEAVGHATALIDRGMELGAPAMRQPEEETVWSAIGAGVGRMGPVRRLQLDAERQVGYQLNNMVRGANYALDDFGRVLDEVERHHKDDGDKDNSRDDDVRQASSKMDTIQDKFSSMDAPMDMEAAKMEAAKMEAAEMGAARDAFSDPIAVADKR